MSESHISEAEWIAALSSRFRTDDAPGRVGIGDDAAALPLPDGEVPVLTVDVMVNGIHFRDPWLTDRQLGSRILRVSLSDLAAMAATPRGALLSIETPRLPGRVGNSFWDGVEETLDEFRMPLLGGNVTRTTGPLAISCTILGGVVPGKEVRRSGARPGDSLWVTGSPGSAGLARRALDSSPVADDPHCPWRRPVPRISTARSLNAAGQISAAIDISDGLGLDLARLLDASGVGATVDITALVERLPSLVTHDVLEGGEDYELLFASPEEELDDVDGVPLTRIGSVTAEKKLTVSAPGMVEPYRPEGWDPFAV